MKVRKLDENGDYSFGHGDSDFIKDTPETVAQSVKTRLLLLTGEWFLDVTSGTPWSTQILGEGTGSTYNSAIRSRILETEGVNSIVSYSSTLDRDKRELSVEATIDTIYGETTLTQVI